MEKLFKTIEEYGGFGCSLWHDKRRNVSFRGIKRPDDVEWRVDVIEETIMPDNDVNRLVIMNTNVDGAIEYIKNNF